MSDLDEAIAALEARRTQEEAERLKRRKFACDFLGAIYEQDVKPSRELKARGIEAWFADGRLVLQRPAEGRFSEPLIIVVGEHGELDAGGKSLGRPEPGQEAAKKKAVIAEVIAHFNF